MNEANVGKVISEISGNIDKSKELSNKMNELFKEQTELHEQIMAIDPTKDIEKFKELNDKYILLTDSINELIEKDTEIVSDSLSKIREI